MKIHTLLLILLVVGACSTSEKSDFDVENHFLSEDEPLPELSIFNLPDHWVNQRGDSVSMSDFRGNPTVMVMIYTSCKAACPRLVADMRHINQSVPEKIRTQVNMVFVSIDPEVDTPEVTSAYLNQNKLSEPYWHFLTGSEADTRSFSMILGVKYKQITPIDFSHSNIISLFDQQGLLVHQQIGLGVTNDEIVEKIISLITS